MTCYSSLIESLMSIAASCPDCRGLAEDGSWDQQKHPRGEKGRFVRKGSGAANESANGQGDAGRHSRPASTEGESGDWVERDASFFGADDEWTRLWQVRGLPDEAKRWVADNFRTLVQSPYGDSFYDTDDVDWNHKPDGSLRLADHWNFSSSYDGKTHCPTSKPIDNVRTWAIGRWDGKRGCYDILKTWDAEGRFDQYPDIRNGYSMAHMVAPRIVLPGTSELHKAINSNYDYATHRFAKPVRYRINRRTGELKVVPND